MRINSTSAALSLQHSLGRNFQRFEQSAQRLSTGVKLNSGKDGPAALISSEQLRAVLASLEAEASILQRQDHVASTAEGTLSEISNVLIDTRVLQVQLGDGTLSAAVRDAIQLQIDSNIQSADRMAQAAGVNGTALFSGSYSLSHGGDSLDLPRVDSNSIGLTQISGVSFRLSDIVSGGALVGDAASSGQVIQHAIGDIATLRGQIGAYQADVIQPALNSTGIAFENIGEATSTLRDTDFAAEVVELNRSALLTRANILMFSRVNEMGSRVLDLLA